MDSDRPEIGKIYRRKNSPDFWAKVIEPSGKGVFLCDCSDGFKRHLSAGTIQRQFEKAEQTKAVLT